MHGSDPEALFSYVAAGLRDRKIAYLHVMEPRVKDNAVVNDHPPIAAANLKPIFGGPVIAAGGFDGKSAEAFVSEGKVDIMVAFGRHFIANPDLPRRLKEVLSLIPIAGIRSIAEASRGISTTRYSTSWKRPRMSEVRREPDLLGLANTLARRARISASIPSRLGWSPFPRAAPSVRRRGSRPPAQARLRSVTPSTRIGFSVQTAAKCTSSSCRNAGAGPKAPVRA
jgi:hypothetical protein